MLIKNAYVVDAKGIRKADVLIEGNKIAKVGRIKGKADIDGRGKLLLPGFYNTHTHIAMTFLRNIGEGLSLHDWLTKKIWPAEAKVKPSLLYHAALLGFVEALKSGTVCVNEMYLKGLDEIIKAGNKVGVRSVVSYGMLDINSSVEEELSKTEKFIAKGTEGLSKKAVACHAPYTCSLELIKRGKRLAKKHKLLFHIHVSETRKEVMDILKAYGKRPVELLYENNILDSYTLMAHASWVTKREIRMAGEKKAIVSHNPASNLKLATGGIMPLEEYAKSNALVTLATDGPASNNNLDMVETMKLAGLLQKHKYWDAKAGNPKLIFKAATLNGAKALRYKSGLISPGYNADLIIVNPKENMHPLSDFYTAIVYSMKRDNVEKVIVDGKLVYDGRPLNVKEREIEKAKKEIEKFASTL